MISREPTIERLATHAACCSNPFGLDEPTLQEALASIGSHKVDDADLYFQITRHEGWSLEEGIVKSGSFSIDQGVGVRAVPARRRPSPIPTTSPRPRCSTPRARCARIAAAGPEQAGQGGRRQRARSARSRALYAPIDPIATLDSTQKVALLEKVEKHGARARPAHRAGDGRPGRRVRRGAGGARRRHPRRRRAAAGAPVGHGDRRAERPPRDRQRRRRRPLRPRLFPGRRASRATSTRRSTPR